MTSRQIKIELLPHERAVLLKGYFLMDEVNDQLKACVSSPHAETITFTSTDVYLLAADLTNAIVKRGCRDDDTIDLSERMDYIYDTGDGSLDGWY